MVCDPTRAGLSSFPRKLPRPCPDLFWNPRPHSPPTQAGAQPLLSDAGAQPEVSPPSQASQGQYSDIGDIGGQSWVGCWVLWASAYSLSVSKTLGSWSLASGSTKAWKGQERLLRRGWDLDGERALDSFPDGGRERSQGESKKPSRVQEPLLPVLKISRKGNSRASLESNPSFFL